MSRFSQRKKGLEILSNIEKRPDHYKIIHYSCESFCSNGFSPKIISIAIMDLGSRQINNFSINYYAELHNATKEELIEKYSEFEKELLSDFFKYLSNNLEYYWIHWNMDDSSYGFEALYNRYRVLGNEPTRISTEKIINLNFLIEEIYGYNYVADPRMKNLKELNQIHSRSFKSGSEEAELFEKNEFSQISMSTQSKVSLFSKFIDYMTDDRLKTQIPCTRFYGSWFVSVFYLFQEKPAFITLGWLVNIIIGAVLGSLFSKFF